MKSYDDFMFSELTTEHETYYKIYDIKNKKLYELDTSDGSFIEQEYIDPYKMINIIEKYSNLNYILSSPSHLRLTWKFQLFFEN